MMVFRICDNCNSFELASAVKCRHCGEVLNPFNKELVSKTIWEERIFENILSQTGNFSPMAILSTDTDVNSVLFHLKNDGKEEEVQLLAEMIRKNKDLVTVLIAITINLPDILARIANSNDGLCVYTLSKSAAIKDIIPLVRNGEKLAFGEAVIRFDITDDFETMGILSVLYEALLGV